MIKCKGGHTIPGGWDVLHYLSWDEMRAKIADLGYGRL